MSHNSMALICTHCEQKARPILFVAFTESDGVYQFLCGFDGHTIDDADPIHLDHVLNDDPTVASLLDIRQTFEAQRATVEDEWSINLNPDLD